MISVDFVGSVGSQKLHQEVVGGDDCLKGIEAQPAEYGIISRWDLDRKESKSLGHLVGSFSNSYKESDRSVDLHGVFRKPD